MKPTGESLLGLLTGILGLVLVGGALVAYIWETLNQLLSGQLDWTRVLVSLPVLAAFLLLLHFIVLILNAYGPFFLGYEYNAPFPRFPPVLTSRSEWV